MLKKILNQNFTVKTSELIRNCYMVEEAGKPHSTEQSLIQTYLTRVSGPFPSPPPYYREEGGKLKRYNKHKHVGATLLSSLLEQFKLIKTKHGNIRRLLNN